ncbi:hypothetical protein ACSBR2_034250 [Camellia fascicularis]
MNEEIESSKSSNKTMPKHKIQKVPQMLLQMGTESNKKCYEPQLVSSGPYHHENTNLKLFKKFKFQFTRELRNASIIHHAPLVRRDLFLLENELPFIVLQVLMRLRFENHDGESMITVFIKRVRGEFVLRVGLIEQIRIFFDNNVWGLVHHEKQQKNSNDEPSIHLLELVRRQYIDPTTFAIGCYITGGWYSRRSAKDFKSVGIQFKPSKTYQLTDIDFNPTCTSGILKLPPMIIDDTTKSILLNLASYEACPDSVTDFGVTSYICFMDSLTDHSEDVKVLRSKGILLNFLGSDQHVADIFNEIATELVPSPYAYVEVTEALAHAGLESSNLIVGRDFTKSNECTVTRNMLILDWYLRSFSRRSLHYIGNGLNPYEQAIPIIGKTLAAFDEDNLIPCYGFGDASTHDQDVFSFYPDDRFCNGFEEVLSQYREIVPHLRLAGPTSFGPIIEMAMTIVEKSGGQYHVLLIIADGQFTRRVNTEHGQLSPQEKKTVEAIVTTSKLSLSIILVGVGDGPWDMMREFDENIPAWAFDNFQFVNFTEIMSNNVAQSRKGTEFALVALMEIPSEYKATIELNILGGRKGNVPKRVPFPAPIYSAPSFSSSKSSCSSNF